MNFHDYFTQLGQNNAQNRNVDMNRHTDFFSSQTKTFHQIAQIYSLYRCIVSIILVSLYFIWANRGNFLGPAGFFILLSVLYLLISLFILSLYLLKKPPNSGATFFCLCVDIFLITLLTWTSNSSLANLQILTVVVVATGSILYTYRVGMLIAALGTIAVFTEHFIEQLASTAPMYRMSVPIGLLGLVFFGTSIITHALSSRLKDSEILASNQAKDILNLKSLNELILQRMHTGILLLNEKGKVLLNNQAALKLLGYEHSLVNTDISQRSPELWKHYQNWKNIKSGKQGSIRIEKTGLELTLSYSYLNPDAVVDTIVFIEDQDKINQQAQNINLTSLGRLAASIAHEIRNPLSAISHAAQLMSENDETQTEDKKLLDIIQKHSLRMDKIIENVLQLSTRSHAKPIRINPKKWLEEYLVGFYEQCQDTPNIQVIINRNVQIQFDPSHLTQVVTNLMNNSVRHAHQEQGVLVVLAIDNDSITGRPVLDIQDNGNGIRPEYHTSIFEPFFTTQAKGTGLGLYLCKELCQLNQAHLAYIPDQSNQITHNNPTLKEKISPKQIDSLKSGACFRIYFAHTNKQLQIS